MHQGSVSIEMRCITYQEQHRGSRVLTDPRHGMEASMKLACRFSGSESSFERLDRYRPSRAGKRRSAVCHVKADGRDRYLVRVGEVRNGK